MAQALGNNELITLITILGTFFGVIITGLVTFIVAKMKETTDVQKFYEDKISALLKAQSKEIHELKRENERLTKEIQKLTQQIIDLKNGQNKE